MILGIGVVKTIKIHKCPKNNYATYFNVLKKIFKFLNFFLLGCTWIFGKKLFYF